MLSVHCFILVHQCIPVLSSPTGHHLINDVPVINHHSTAVLSFKHIGYYQLLMPTIKFADKWWQLLLLLLSIHVVSPGDR